MRWISDETWQNDGRMKVTNDSNDKGNLSHLLLEHLN